MTEGTIRLGADGILYLDFGGKTIAKRDSGGNWTILEPGYKVAGGEPGNYDSISVEYDPELAKPH